MLLQAMNPENEGDLDLNFLVRKDELIPSQPKINSVSNDLSLDVTDLEGIQGLRIDNDAPSPPPPGSVFEPREPWSVDWSVAPPTRAPASPEAGANVGSQAGPTDGCV